MVKDLFSAVVKATPVKEFSKFNNNCHTFSKTLWDILFAKQKFAERAL